MTVAVLFAREDSCYQALPGVEVFDVERDARTYEWAVACSGAPSLPSMGAAAGLCEPEARRAQPWPPGCGPGAGIWRRAGIPGRLDAVAGAEPAATWRARRLRRLDAGRAAEVVGAQGEKATWFYVVGCEPRDQPAMPLVLGDAAYVVQSRKREDYRPHITKAEREHTPPELASWLVELANRCKGHNVELTGAEGVRVE